MIVNDKYTCVCEICGSSAIQAYNKDSYKIFRCSGCDFLFVNPYPSDSEISDYYNKNYRSIDSDFYPKASSRRRRTFFKSIRFWNFIFKKKVLDVGCGGGFMVNAFRRLGAEAHGMDISENSIAYARKHFPDCTFHHDSFASMAKKGLVFDFIFTTELLEHIPGTGEFMNMIVSITRPGTVVYLATPDTGHNSVPERITTWSDICPPAHIQWFNRSNMTQLFGNHGFELIKVFNKKTPALSMLFKRTGK